jgi:hypothetical protein
LYISDEGTNDVHVFAWPKGDLVGKLTGFWYPQGECVDRAGNVFIVNLGKGNIVEYAHGGTTPIATLANGGETLVGCAVDPKTGNLAATNFGNGRQGAYVSVYRKARGRPTNYGFFYSGFTFCSYGDAGNLYADYFDWQSQGIGIAELPYQPGGAPGTKLLSISTQPGLKIPGGVQWDGKYLAVGDTYRDVVYRFVISGSNAIQANAALAGAPALNGGSRIMQFWIEGNLVVGSSLGTGNAMVWDYPNGGNEVKTLGGLTAPFGAVISPHKSLRVASVPR